MKKLTCCLVLLSFAATLGLSQGEFSSPVNNSCFDAVLGKYDDLLYRHHVRTRYRRNNPEKRQEEINGVEDVIPFLVDRLKAIQL